MYVCLFFPIQPLLHCSMPLDSSPVLEYPSMSHPRGKRIRGPWAMGPASCILRVEIFQIMPMQRWPDMWPNFQCVANLSNCIMYVYSFQFNGRSLLCCSVPLDFARKLTSRNSSCLGISPHEPPTREARPRRFRRC